MSMTAMKTDIPQEIEIKFTVPKDQAEKLFNFLYSKTIFLGHRKQIDVYFDTNDKKLTSVNQKLRIRQERLLNGKKVKKFLCFKQKHFNSETNLCERVDELDVKFGDTNNVLRIFDVLGMDVFFPDKTPKGAINIPLYLEKAGYKEFAKVEKNRALYRYQYTFEIAIDELKGLPGAFIEIELKGYKGGVEEGKQKIYRFLKDTVGLKSIEEFNIDYLAMVQDHKKIVFNEINLEEVFKK